jgi:hypothetical protein
MRARTVGQVIAGEAVSGSDEERWADMVAIASVIANRAQSLGVTPQQIISAPTKYGFEFNAYNSPMPAGTSELVGMAEEAMNYVEENGPVNNATFYATPAAVNNLPSGLQAETSTTGHQYFSDPQHRAIGTSLGYRQPNQYAYAANPQNVPAPDQPSLMAGTGELGNTWTINGVTPHLGPVPETWSAMAAANPVQTPTGLLSAAPAQNSFAEMAAAGPMGLLSTPNISQSDIARAFTNVTAKNEFDPSFTANLMGPNNPVVPTAVETSSFTQTPSIGPVASVVGTGIYSPEHINGVQAQAEKQLAAARAMQPGLSVPASGILSANPALEASATVPSGLLNSYVAQPSITPAEQAINSVMAAPSDMMRELPGFHVNPLDGNIVPDRVAAAPALDTVQVADQPTISAPAEDSVQGPATTPAVTQQTQQAVTRQATQPTLGDKLKSAVNPGTAIGGILGSATLGPIGGILGGLLGNSINNGSFAGLLGNQAPAMNTIGVGPVASYAVWGGGAAPGTTAIASDGSRVSAQGGGDVARTNGFGVTDVANSYGGYSSDWSGWY